MVDESIKIDLDPQKVLDALKAMGKQAEELSKSIEDSLGKSAVKSVDDLEKASEKGAARISTFFGNLSKRVKEDLGKAFNLSQVVAGAKFTDEILKGARAVFEMERAFDRLNVRLGLSHQKFMALKTEMGKTVASTGASLEKVLPGIESIAGKGGLKNPTQLNDVAGILGKFNAGTGEDTGQISDTIVETLQRQGRPVIAATFKDVLDSSMAARNAGAFHTAGEAANAMKDISGLKNLKLSSREQAALVTQASGAGEAGQGVLSSLLQTVNKRGPEMQKLESLLGTQFYKGGKFDVNSLGKMNLGKLGGMSQEQTAEIFGAGSSGEDFVRFANTFKQGNDRFKAVMQGADETNVAFERATQNLASRFDKFRQKLENAGREIVGQGAEMVEGALSGSGHRMEAGFKGIRAGVADNAGTLAMGTAGTLAMGLLTGNGLRGLMGGVASTAQGVAKGKALQQASGVQPVYVTNAKEIGDGSGGAAGAAATAAGFGGKLGAGAMLGIAGLVAAFSPEIGGALGSGAFAAKGALFGNDSDEQQAKLEEMQRNSAKKMGINTEGMSADQLAQALAVAMARVRLQAEVKGGHMTNPSAVSSVQRSN